MRMRNALELSVKKDGSCLRKKMALLRDVVCKPYPSVKQLIEYEIKQLNLKILKRLTIKFDPFRNDIEHVRNFSHLIHHPNARASNLKFVIKTEVLTDLSEQTLTFDLTNGQKYIFKCGNLETLDIFKLINQHLTPLSPIDEVSSTVSKLEKKGSKRGESSKPTKKGKPEKK